MKSVISIVLASVVLTGSVFAQSRTAAKTDDKTLGTVYIYRNDYDPFLYSFIFSRRLSVKFAEAGDELPQIASLRKDRYMIMKLKPGRYLFNTRMMTGKLAIDLAAGEQRYLRWDHGNECPTIDPMDYAAAISNDCEQRGAAIFEMLPEKGRTEIKK